MQGPCRSRSPGLQAASHPSAWRSRRLPPVRGRVEGIPPPAQSSHAFPRKTRQAATSPPALPQMICLQILLPSGGLSEALSRNPPGPSGIQAP